MPADTTRYSFPYQTDSDAPDGPALGQDLAEAVEAALGALEDAHDAVDTRLTALEAGPTVRACKLAQQSGQNIPDGSDTVLTFGSGSEEIDTHGWHSTSSNTSRITVDRTGYYEVTAQVAYAFNTTLNYCDIAIRKNGSTLYRSGNLAPTGANNVSKSGGSITELIAANSGDYFEASALQNSTGDVAQTTNTGGAGTRFTVRYVGQ